MSRLISNRKAIAVLFASTTLLALPAGTLGQVVESPTPSADNDGNSFEGPTGDLAPRKQDAIGAEWLEQLRRYYSTGDPTLVPSATSMGLEQLRAFDWRFNAVEAGLVTFDESWEVIESTQWDEAYAGSDLVGFELRLGIDVARLAETKLGGSDATIEKSDGTQRRAFNATFVWDAASSGWVLDAISVPAGGAYDYGFLASAPVVPCPRLGNPSTARDPFSMRPWCTANGDGQRLKVGQSRRKQQIAPALSFGTGANCGWDAALFVWTGWPPGEPLDPQSGLAHRYVRDPKGQVPGAKAYRRDIRPPRDAISTGVTNGHATIWTSETLGEDAILVQVGSRFERWPQSSAGCTGN